MVERNGSSENEWGKRGQISNLTPLDANLSPLDAADNETRPRRVLIVEDDDGLMNLILKALRNAGYEVDGVATGAAAIERVKADPGWTLLLDQKLPDMAGSDIIKALNEKGLRIPFIVMTGQGDERLAVEMMKLGAADYLVKTLNFVALLPGLFQRLFRELDNERQLHATEARLRESEESHRSILRTAMDGICRVDLQGRLLEVNDAYCRMSGYSETELLEMRIADLETAETADDTAAHIRRIMAQRDDRFESRQRRKDGSAYDVEISVQYRTSEGGQFVAFQRDITGRKHREKVQAFLTQTGTGTAGEPFFEGLARFLAQSLGMDFVCIDRLDGDELTARTVAVWHDGKFEDNVSYALKDTPCGEVVGKQVCCFPASVCQFFPHDQVLQDLRAESYVGVTLWGHTGQPIGLIAVIGRKPLTNRQLAEATLEMVAMRAAGELERLDAETSLRESEEKFRLAMDATNDGLWDWNMVTNEVYRNPCHATMLRYEPQEFCSSQNEWEKLIHPDDKQIVFDCLGSHLKGETPFFALEYRLRRKSGDYLWVLGRGKVVAYDNAGTPIRMVGTNVDITERKQAEEEKGKLQNHLLQAQKIDSIGRLAGGVAHDFNNMLGVILGHAEIALEQVDPAQPLYANIQEILKAAQRSSDLTSRLLAFARKQTVSPKVLDLNETVTGMLKMLQRLIGENIHLAWMPGINLWPVKVDPSQIDQLLTNLCVNSRDAIADTGKITIETGNSAFDEAYCVDHVGFVPGEFVLLVVSDNGLGMDKETQSKLFEPFYTTKETGKGTGLGLAMVYGIVKQNNGFINVYSEPDQGTTFKLYLPRHIGKGEDVLTDGPAEPMRHGQETILLAEDEPALLDLTTMLLSRQGYTVLAAGTPGEAIRLAREHAGEIHLLMTDVVMPEMNGRDLAKTLISLSPRLKILFMSGYTANVIAHRGVLDAGVHFIQKPFSRKDLAAKVREALDSELSCHDAASSPSGETDLE